MGYDVYGSYTSNYIFAHRKAPKEVIDFLRERLATLKGNEALKADLVKSGVEQPYSPRRKRKPECPVYQEHRQRFRSAAKEELIVSVISAVQVEKGPEKPGLSG